MTIGRRQFLVALTGLSLASPLADAQQRGKIARIGRLSPGSIAFDARNFGALKQGLGDLGWIEGQNIAFESRFADGKLDQLPALAAELVSLKVDIIIAGSSPGILAARNATTTIPIVMVTTGDPVTGGLVPGLAHPGGNLTGVTVLSQELSGKLLELLKRAVPRISRVGILGGQAYPSKQLASGVMQRVAHTLAMTLHPVDALTPIGIDGAFTAMSKERVQGLLVLPDPFFTSQQERITSLAAKYRLPAAYELSEFVDHGGLMFYGATLQEMYRHAATYVDKILKGANPADLPVEQPTKFELVINLKAAKQIGLTIPQSVLLRADRVIE